MAVTTRQMEDPAPLGATPARKTDPAKERMLDTAYALFSARGYADVSMQEIANEIGMTKAALYYHFADKKTLFLAVYVRSLVRYREFMAAELATGNSLQETLTRVATFVLEYGRGELRRINTDVVTFIPVEERVAIFDRYGHPSALLSDYLAEQQAAGAIRDDVDVAFTGPLFLSMISGQVRRFSNELARGSPVSQLTDREIAEKIVAITLHGIV